MTSSRRRGAERELTSIRLYSPEYPDGSDLDSVRLFLKGYFPSVDIRIESPILSGLLGRTLEAVSTRLANSRVKDPSEEHQSYEPMFGEVDFERRAAMGKARVGGVVYDGRKLGEVYASLSDANLGLEVARIVFTQRLVSTYSRDDMRHHLRTVVCSFPSIVSIPGVIEAPAKPRDYHMLRQELESMGAGELQLERLKSDFRGRFIDYGDPEVNEVLKGLALQTVLFHMTLKPFCEHPDCRLFNAHWQEELIRSQVKDGGLCKMHERLLHQLGKRPLLMW
jgi:hypothetical protein